MNDERRHHHDVLAADHDHTRHDGQTGTLPGNPDLRQLRAQAKDLRRGVHRNVPTDVERLRHSSAHVLASVILCHSERSAAKSTNLSML